MGALIDPEIGAHKVNAELYEEGGTDWDGEY